MEPTVAPRRPLRILRRILVVFVVVVALLAVIFGIYANTVSLGDRETSLIVWNNPAVDVQVTDHSIVMTPTGESYGEGLVFIPGAKVEPAAYLYKLSGLVESAGMTVVITKPTLNLAFFDTRPLSTFEADAPDVQTWSVGGHSLGGVRACQLADDPTVSGLILFGSYCANDLSETDLTVLSISGSNDGLSTPQKIEGARHTLPADATLVEIEGANHASFGDYGVQAGDGQATTPSDQVRDQITDAILTAFPVGVGL